MSQMDSGGTERGLAESVSRAVERESRRRRRLLAIYLSLLAVPVISAVALIGLGQQEMMMGETVAGSSPIDVAGPIVLASDQVDEVYTMVMDTLRPQLEAADERYVTQAQRLSELQNEVERRPVAGPSLPPAAAAPDQELYELLDRVRYLEQRLARLEAENHAMGVTVDSLVERLRSINPGND